MAVKETPARREEAEQTLCMMIVPGPFYRFIPGYREKLQSSAAVGPSQSHNGMG